MQRRVRGLVVLLQLLPRGAALRRRDLLQAMSRFSEGKHFVLSSSATTLEFLQDVIMIIHTKTYENLEMTDKKLKRSLHGRSYHCTV